MAFMTSQETFHNMFYESNNISEKLMDAIMTYLKAHLYIVRLKKLYEWISEGRNISVFSCRRDVLDAMAENMNISKIPFLIISDPDGNSGFLIRSEDKESAVNSAKAVLEEKSKFCTITSMQGLKKIITSSKHKNKGIISITGLSTAQMYILEQMAIRNLGVEAIGEDRMSDGTYRFTVHGMTATKKDQNQVNLGLLLLQMQMMTEGPGKEKNILRAENGFMYSKYIAEVLKKNGRFQPFYIIDGKGFMKITQEGFECGSGRVEGGGHVKINPQLVYQKAIPDYEAQLLSRLGRMSNPLCTTDISEAYSLIAKSSRYDLDEKDRDVQAAEKIVARSINSVVLQKVERDSTMRVEGQYAAKAAHVISEMSKVMRGAITGNTPAGYEDTFIQKVGITMEQEGLEPREYANVVRSLEAMEIVPIAETIERINIDKKLDELDVAAIGSRKADEMER